MKKLADWKGGKGVNKDLLPAELELGVWSDSNNMRFRNGFDEKMGGIADVMTSLPVTPYALFPYQTSSTRYVVAMGLAKAYAHNGTSWTEISRSNAAVPVLSIVDTSTGGGGGTTRTLTTVYAHGLSTGANVDVSGCTGATAADYNEAGVSITVTSTTTFRYSGGGTNDPATSPAEGSPVYTINSGAPSTDFAHTADSKWTGGNLSGVLIVNSSVDGLFYWDGNTSNDFVRLSVVTYLADVGRPFRDWFVQLGTTESGTKYPRRVLWSAAAEPGALPTSFDAASTNDAGKVDLDDTNGACIDGYPLGDVFHIYKDDRRYAMQWIGGNEVFRFTPIDDSSGLMAANCIANTGDGRQVFLTKSGDVRIHSGGLSESIAEGRIRNYLAGDIDSTYKSRAFLCENPFTKEIWIHYPRSGSTTCNGAIVWNWRDNTWAISHRSLNITAAASGMLPTAVATDPRMIIGTSVPKIGLVDSGSTDFGTTVTATLERVGIHLGEETKFKTLSQSSISGDMTAANTASVYHGSHATADAAASWTSAITYTHNTTDRLSAFANSAKYIAWKMSTTAADWKHRTIRFFGSIAGDY